MRLRLWKKKARERAISATPWDGALSDRERYEVTLALPDPPEGQRDYVDELLEFAGERGWRWIRLEVVPASEMEQQAVPFAAIFDRLASEFENASSDLRLGTPLSLVLEELGLPLWDAHRDFGAMGVGRVLDDLATEARQLDYCEVCGGIAGSHDDGCENALVGDEPARVDANQLRLGGA